MSSGCGEICAKSLNCKKVQSDNVIKNRQIFVRSIVSEKITDDDGNRFVEYTFLCSANLGTGNVTWDVKRRHSDFQNLHKHLKKQGHVEAEFPTSGLMSRLSISSLLRGRDCALKDYLNSVLDNCNDEQCELLSKFLRVNKHIQRPRCEDESVKCATAIANSKSIHSTEQKSGSQDHCSKRPISQSASTRVPTSSLRLSTGSNGERNGQRVGVVRANGSTSSSSDDDRGQEPTEKVRSKSQFSAAQNGHQNFECVCCEAETSLPVDDIEHRRMEIMKQQQVLLADLRKRQSGNLSTCQDLSDVHAWDDSGSRCNGPSSGTANSKDPIGHAFNQELASFAGVGLVFVHLDDAFNEPSVFVDAILPNSPAAADGRVQVGDKLVAVDGVDVFGEDLFRIRNLIVGRVGSSVRLSFERSQGLSMAVEPFSFSVDLCRASATSPREPSGKSLCASESVIDDLGSDECLQCNSTVQAVFNYSAVRSHEMSLSVGDVVTVLRKHKSGWWEGHVAGTGVRGWFPSNHVQSAADEESDGASNSSTDGDGEPPRALTGSDSSGSGPALSLRSTVRQQSRAWGAAGEEEEDGAGGSKVDEVCSWLRSVDLAPVAAAAPATAGGLAAQRDYSGIRGLSSR